MCLVKKWISLDHYCLLVFLMSFFFQFLKFFYLFTVQFSVTGGRIGSRSRIYVVALCLNQEEVTASEKPWGLVGRSLP